MKVSLTIEPDASPAEVYATISDLGFLAKVDSDVTKMERLFDGDIEVGSTFREHLALPGMAIVADLTLTELDPDRVVAFEFQSKQMRGTGRFQIEERAGGSKVSLDVDARMRGFWKLIWPMVRIEFPMREKKRIRNLGELVEGTFVEVG